jgi:hypothetical protein
VRGLLLGVNVSGLAHVCVRAALGCNASRDARAVRGLLPDAHGTSAFRKRRARTFGFLPNKMHRYLRVDSGGAVCARAARHILL